MPLVGRSWVKTRGSSSICSAIGKCLPWRGKSEGLSAEMVASASGVSGLSCSVLRAWYGRRGLDFGRRHGCARHLEPCALGCSLSLGLGSIGIDADQGPVRVRAISTRSRLFVTRHAVSRAGLAVP
jgi:hypothetical protein